MENKNKKIDFINNVLNNILFTDGKLYKIIKANTANIYAFEYILNKELESDINITFYTIGDTVSYYNFKNEMNPTKTKLKLNYLLGSPYKIIDNIDISNLYFITYSKKLKLRDITIKNDFNESLFNTNINKLKDIYEIKHFINNMLSDMINIDNTYYRKIRQEKLENKKYFNRNFTSQEIKELCETNVEYMKPITYEQYININ